MEHEGMVIVSNHHQSTIKGVKKVFPNIVHGFCVQHLKANLTTKSSGIPVGDIFDNCARAYCVEKFHYFLEQMRALNSKIVTYLEEIDYEKWARAYFLGKRYTVLTTNIAESLNAVTRHARELPIVSLLEWFRGMLQR